MSCIPYALYLCIILIDFHHIDDPSLLHIFVSFLISWLYFDYDTVAKLKGEK